MRTLSNLLAVGMLTATCAWSAPAPTAPTTYKAATVVDVTKGTRLEVSPQVAVVFGVGAFAHDTAVTADLDLASRRLTLFSRGGAPKGGRVQIDLDQSVLQRGLQLLQQHLDDSGSRFTGMVTAVRQQPRPELVATTDSGLEPLLIDDSTIVLLSENGKRAQREDWRNLGYGDQIRVRYVSGRRADLVEASRVTAEASVHHVSANRIALVGATKPLTVNPNARIEEADGKPLALAALQPDDKISYRVHPDTGEAWYLRRTVKAADAVPQLVLNHDGDKPLLPGDRVRIRASGPSGGTVSFDVVGVEANLAAHELRELPGTYEHLYTVPRGIRVTEAKIAGRIRMPNGRVNMIVADKPLRFAEAGATQPATTTPTTTKPPVAATGQKPKAPLVITPKNGDQVGATVVFAGTAAPNTKVKIAIAYVVTKSVFKLGEGNLPEVELTTDAQGVFRSEPLSTDVRTLIKGDADYTVKVTAVAADGTESDPTTLKLRRPS